MNSTNTRTHIHLPKNFADTLADKVVQNMGSWRFLILQSVAVSLWISLNIIGLIHHWDVYPFILLNLLFSTQAAYSSPLILMAANRGAAKDRVRDDTEAMEVDQLIQNHIVLMDVQGTQLQLLNELHVLALQLHDHLLGEK